MSDRIVVMRDGKAEQIERQPKSTEPLAQSLWLHSSANATCLRRPSKRYLTARFFALRNLWATESRQSHGISGQPRQHHKVGRTPRKYCYWLCREEKENSGTVQIRDQIFVSSTSRCIVKLANGNEFNVEGAGVAELKETEQVQIGWSAKDLLVLADGVNDGEVNRRNSTNLGRCHSSHSVSSDFFVVPLGYLVIVSFWTLSPQGFEILPEWTLKNYHQFFNAKVNMIGYGRSIYIIYFGQ